VDGEEDPHTENASIAKPILVRWLRRVWLLRLSSWSPQMLLIYFVPGRCRCLGAVPGGVRSAAAVAVCMCCKKNGSFHGTETEVPPCTKPPHKGPQSSQSIPSRADSCAVSARPRPWPGLLWLRCTVLVSGLASVSLSLSFISSVSNHVFLTRAISLAARDPKRVWARHWFACLSSALSNPPCTCNCSPSLLGGMLQRAAWGVFRRSHSRGVTSKSATPCCRQHGLTSPHKQIVAQQTLGS
jgi:hypothetical protein